MSIEFIRDEFLEGKKEELEAIDKKLSEKRKPVDRKVLFLRRFTLALMGQYEIKKKHLKKKDIEMRILNKHIEQGLENVHQFKRPVQRLMPTPPHVIPTPTRLNAPSPQLDMPLPKKKLNVPVPIESAEPVKKEMNVPNPI